MDNAQREQQPRKPIAVLTADVHYNINTIEVANAAMKQVIQLANLLEVPLIVAGDLHDTKAFLRGECVAAMIETFKLCRILPIVTCGNHCRISEKSEAHSLEFLRPYATIIDKPTRNLIPYWTFIPYQHDPAAMRAYLKTLPPGTNIIMHQGVQGSLAGAYFMDHSAITKEDIAPFNVISGHYHSRNDLYIGNPYTLSFGEANDPEKGFKILYDDNSLDFVSTNLRKHLVFEMDSRLTCDTSTYVPGDIVWIKVLGTNEELATITKEKITQATGIASFKLDLLPSQSTVLPIADSIKDLTQPETIDSIITKLHLSSSSTYRLKNLWKKLVDNETT